MNDDHAVGEARATRPLAFRDVAFVGIVGAAMGAGVVLSIRRHETPPEPAPVASPLAVLPTTPVASRPDDPTALCESAWNVVCDPRAAEADLRRAMQMAETAMKYAPEEDLRDARIESERTNAPARSEEELARANAVVVLGAAKYRAGDFAGAVDALSPVVANPKEWFAYSDYCPAFLAMAQARLGRAEDARKSLGKMLGATQIHAWLRGDACAQALLREAQAVVDGADKPPK